MFLWLATSKRIFLLCLNTIKQYIFALVKSIPIPFEILPTHTYTHAQAHFQQQTQKWNHIVVFGKEKWNRNPEDHDNKGSNNLNHFMTLNEMEMVWLRYEFFHPIPATALHAKQVLLLLPTNSSNTQHYIIIWCTIELKKNLTLLSWYTCGAPWK